MLARPLQRLSLIYAFGCIHSQTLTLLNASVNATFSLRVFGVSAHFQSLKGAFEHLSSNVVERCF